MAADFPGLILRPQMGLAEWLAWQETQHARQIDLGLERTRPVLQTLELDQPQHVIITVAGTNGKGSSVAFLEAILVAAGYKIGAYSSPHLLRYNERVRLNGYEVEDELLCAAFERIDQARGDISLTYFEFGTLAAFDIFARAKVDIAILEVGLGGRLDTVNLLDADVALVTSIGIDHEQFLGNNREDIGREKAGIFRALQPAICGERAPPQSVLLHAQGLATPVYYLGRDFDFQPDGDTWSWWGRVDGDIRQFRDLPCPKLQGSFQLQNAAAVLMVLQHVAARFPLSANDIARGLSSVNLAGRFQVIAGAVTRIFDVAHNPHGATVLALALREHACSGRTHAVLGMLADKDSAGVMAAMKASIDDWYMGSLAVARGASAEHLAQQLQTIDSACHVQTFPCVSAAWQQALAEAKPHDRVVVFGSFYTVAEALQES